MSDTCKSYIGGNTPVSVSFDYTPGEPTILYPNDKADPGCEETVEITEVDLDGDDILEDLNDGVIARFEREILEYIHEMRDTGGENL